MCAKGLLDTIIALREANAGSSANFNNAVIPYMGIRGVRFTTTVDGYAVMSIPGCFMLLIDQNTFKVGRNAAVIAYVKTLLLLNAHAGVKDVVVTVKTMGNKKVQGDKLDGMMRQFAGRLAWAANTDIGIDIGLPSVMKSMNDGRTVTDAICTVSRGMTGSSAFDDPKSFAGHDNVDTVITAGLAKVALGNPF
jgi:hypothetical protein